MIRKNQLLTLILSISLISTNSWAGLVQCQYNLRGFVRILINFPEITNRLTYTAHNHPSPLFLPVTAFDELLPGEFTIRGDLPAPWIAGSTYQIDYRTNSPFASITYLGPSGNKSTIRMVCR